MSLSKLFDDEPRKNVRGSLTSASTLDMFFEEEPVSLSVFVQDRKYLGSPSLSLIQYDAVQHIERIYLPETYPMMAKTFGGYWSKEVRLCNFINVEWGKGAGKDMIARVAALRIAYLLMCLKSPQAYYGMPDVDSIHMLNVALEAGQAQRNFFQPMIQAVKRKGNWFEDRATPTKQSVMFDKNIESISGHSQAESQEGMNLILGVADEIDAFASAKDILIGNKQSMREPKNTAEYILKMLRTSGASRFPKVHKQVRISFPRTKGGVIQSLRKDSEARVRGKPKSSNHYFSGPFATWEVNPNRSREDFDTDYEEDPVAAAAMYECKPSFSMNPFFRNMDSLNSALRAETEPAIAVDYVCSNDSWAPFYTFNEDFYPVEGAIYAMHADLAVSGDRAGVSMSHIVKMEEIEEPIADETGFIHYKREMLPVVKTDFSICFEPDIKADPPRLIQIRWARELCFQLQKMGFNVAVLTFDNFQSTDSMQILKTHGIDSYRVSCDLTNEPYVNLRDMVESGRISIPNSEILKQELLGLQRKSNGKIDHAPRGSKDISDSVAASVLGALEVGGSEAVSGARAYYSTPEFHVGKQVGISEYYKNVTLDDIHPENLHNIFTTPPINPWLR